MGKGKLIVFGLIVLAVVGAVIFFQSRSSPDQGKGTEKVLGENVSVMLFTTGGTPYGKGLIRVPMLKTTDTLSKIDIYLDIDGNGSFAADEHFIKGFPVRPRANWNNGYPFSSDRDITSGMLARVVLDGSESVEGAVTLETHESGALLDLATVTNPEESMKGWGVVFAGEPVTSASRGGVPDLGQRIAECAPTSAANSIMSLAEEHGMSLTDLPSPTDIVDGLKGDMNWTPADGVLPDNFVRGKNEWAAKNGLPIRTEKVGDQHGASTLEKILDAMANGAASELRLKFGDPQTRRTVGGHMVTVTGVRAEGGQTFIDVNDPKTPSGTETYEVVGNEVIGYPFDGITVISWGFVQVWEGTLTGAPLETMTEEEVQGIREFAGEKKKVKVIPYQGKKIPLSQVHVGKGPECDSEANQIPHYHANTGSATALDGTVIIDPGGCGFGKVPNVPVEEVEIP